MLTLNEAKMLIEPMLTADHAAAYAAETDKLLWIEYNLFPLIEVQSSTNTVFGQALAEFIEDHLEEAS